MQDHETVRPMTTGQLRDIAATIIGGVPDLTFDEADRLIGDKTPLIAAVREAILGRVSSREVVRQPKQGLLEPLGMVRIPPTTAMFTVRDAFRVDTGRKVQAKIAWIGDNFKQWFLGKTEGPMPETTLYFAELLKPSLDKEIVEELGGEKETSLTRIFSLMSCQQDGEDGVLLTNGYANIFYVVGVDGALRMVSMDWSAGSGGWYVSAASIDYPDRWSRGDRVFSSNSIPSVTAAS